MKHNIYSPRVKAFFRQSINTLIFVCSGLTLEEVLCEEVLERTGRKLSNNNNLNNVG